MKDEKLKQAISELEHALKYEKKISQDRFFYSGIAKTFETCFEYAWKHFKRRAIKDGLEVFSPRDAIKMGGRLGLITNVEKWIKFLDDRNLAVHDYLGVPSDEYLKTIHEFLAEAKKLSL